MLLPSEPKDLTLQHISTLSLFDDYNPMQVNFSIIVPVYNAAEFLDETIESVILQTYPHWEMILVDDGSTDGSAQIIKNWMAKDNRIKYIHKENGGQASARNVGIRSANFEHIAFLDADDIYTSVKLSQQANEIQMHDADFLYGLGYHYFADRDEKLEPYDWTTGKRSGSEMFSILYHSNSVNTDTVVVKKSLLKKVGLFDENELLRGSEDWDLWLRICKEPIVVFGSESRNVYYRVHARSISQQKARMKIGRWKIYEKYDMDSAINPLARKREYRYTFRELMNHLRDEGRTSEVSDTFRIFLKKDRFGFGTIMQRLFSVLPANAFLWISNKIVYRIAYRIEKLHYKLKQI